MDIKALFEKYNMIYGCAPFKAAAQKPVEGACTVLMGALPYYFPVQQGQNLARFAALTDYHIYVKGILNEIANILRLEYSDKFFLTFTDNSPIDEKKAAVLSGIAFMGSNNLCITKQGSFVFLGEIITDLETEYVISEKTGCINCGKCIKSCPTGALTNGFDYEKCISYITQKKGVLTEWEKEVIKKSKTIWGCDICQDVCPYNQELPTAEIAKKDILLSVSKDYISSLTKTQFKNKYKNRAFAWRGKNTILRNLNLQ